MAADKSSFILYSDTVHTVKKLPDDVAGKLFKHILMYVNDENPESDDILVNVAFEPIKQHLKRNLKEWEITKNSRSDAGVLGNLKRWNNDLYTQVINNQLSLSEASQIAKDRKVSQPIANIAVNDSVNGNVSVNDKKNNIEDRKLKFASTLEAFKDIYPRTLLNDFYKYWAEPNKSKTKFKQELEKTWDLSRRLETWARNDRSFTKSESNTSNGQSTGLGKSKELS